MKVFLSGPYSLGDAAYNVRVAIIAADQLMAAGHAVFVPHLSHFQHIVCPRPYDDWLTNDLAWLAVADCVVRLPGRSAGADREVFYARELGKPVYSLAQALEEGREVE